MTSDNNHPRVSEAPENEADVNEASGFGPSVNGSMQDVQRDTVAGIPSVNGQRNGEKGSRAAKAFILVAIGAVLVGGLIIFLGQHLTKMKNDFKSSSSQKSKSSEASATTMLNPEGGKQTSEKRLALGAAGAPVASAPARGLGLQPAGEGPAPGGEVRPLRGPDGKVMMNAQGKSLGVDANGNLVEVPPIVALGGETSDRKPLPGPSTSATSSKPTSPSATGGQPGAPEKKPPSRFGGALNADGAEGTRGSSAQAGNAQLTSTSYGAQAAPAGTNAGGSATGARGGNPMYNEVLGKLMGRLDTALPSGGAAAQSQPSAARQAAGSGGGDGPVSSQMTSSATPVAHARRTQNQSLMLPSGRQADCVLTTRIINELPGFTSCVLDSDLYGADGKVKLLEKGSDIIGEYGSSTQVGLRRLFIVWTRARTPEGVEIDLQSPGADALGTSGVPGFLEQRWFERIGAALLISVMKDTVALATARETGSGGGSVVVQPGQNTTQTGQNIAEQILRQTINTKPTLYINQGERVSVRVARDLDFSTVYALRSVEQTVAKER